MADKEYIERSSFLRKCAEAWGPYGVTIKFIEEIADECTAADVAPRSEVARGIFEEIKSHIASMEYNANTPRKTVKVEKLKEQVDWVLHTVIPQTLDEIEKKYTEVTTMKQTVLGNTLTRVARGAHQPKSDGAFKPDPHHRDHKEDISVCLNCKRENCTGKCVNVKPKESGGK